MKNARLAIFALIASTGISNVGFASDGKAIYESACKMCHGTGMMGAPKVGDAAVWKDKTSKGIDVLVKNAIDGVKSAKGTMPPRGGNPKLSDDDIKASVAYMVDNSK